MPERATRQRVERDRREGKAASTRAGEFVREEIDRVREGKHGARPPRQAIAIGLSKARRAGVKLPSPRAGATSPRTRRQALRDARAGARSVSSRFSRAAPGALTREGRAAASRSALSRQGRTAAARRTKQSRSAARHAAVTRRRRR